MKINTFFLGNLFFGIVTIFFTNDSDAQKTQFVAGQSSLGKDTVKYSFSDYFDGLYDETKAQYEFKGNTTSDFKKWKNAFLPRLKLSLGLDLIEMKLRNWALKAEKKVSKDNGSFVMEEWIVWTEPNVPLPVVVLIPKNKNGKIPLVITTHGHGKNANLYDGNYPRIFKNDTSSNVGLTIAMQAVNQGYIAIAPTMRAFGSTRFEADKQSDVSFSCHTQLMRDLLVGRTVIGDRVWDMSKILDWALLNFPIDTNRIAITGNSGGGTVSLFTAACDKRITVACPSSYFCTFKGSIGTIAHCDCNYIPGILALGEMGDIAGLIAPRPLGLIHGIKDAIFPIEETRKAFSHLQQIYKAAGAPANVSLYEGDGGHQYYPEGSWPFIKQFFAVKNKK